MVRDARLRAAAVIVAIVSATSAGVAGLQRPVPPPIPAKAGAADGTLTAGKVTVVLTHAYALGPIDSAGGIVYQIVLTAGPIPPEALPKELARAGGQALLRAGKLSGLGLLVDEKGYIRNIVPFVGDDLRGSRMISGGDTLQNFAVKQGTVTGQGSMSLASSMGQGWSYAASWNATVVRP